ncbi:MAG TPA: thioredoxin [Actinomycetota bacterium]|jgi:thioredoxin 1|nr:thioredoxin [Actinomycetota bacterium]
MAGPTIQVTDADFEEKVLGSSTPVLVDFWAEWCGPCHMVAPVLEEIASEKQGALTIAKLDIDENPDTARRFGILSIPSMLLFVDGVEKRRLVGARGKQQILGDLAEFLA